MNDFSKYIPSMLRVGDFNADGYPEILITVGSGVNAHSILLANFEVIINHH
jgi:hypothetical protein